MIKSIINAPFFNTVLMALFMLVFTIFNIWHNIKTRKDDALTKEIEGLKSRCDVRHKEYVARDDCSPAMKRVGKQVDKLEARVDNHDQSIGHIKIGLAFLVGKQGGDPSEMGLT